MPHIFEPSGDQQIRSLDNAYSPSLRLTFYWILMTGVAGAAISSLPFKLNGENFSDPAAFVFVCTAQWLLLGRFVPKVSGWLWLSVTGGIIGVLLGIMPAVRVQDAIDGIKSSSLGIAAMGGGRSAFGFFVASAVMGAGFGGGLGLFQWFALRWWFPKADWWILVSAVGSAGGMVLNGMLSLMLGAAARSLNLEFVVPGLSTGLALYWLVAKSSPMVIESMSAKRPWIRVALEQSPGEVSKLPPRPLGVSILAATAFVGAAGGILILLLAIKDKPQTAAFAGFIVIVWLVAPTLLIGIGLLKQRGWARALVLFMAAWGPLCLLFAGDLVPAGFAVCIAALFILATWYLCRPGVMRCFTVNEDARG